MSVLSQQLLKTGLNSAMVSGTEAIANALGPKVCAAIINAFRSGSNIYGAAAMKSAAKLLRGNAVVAGLTAVALSSVDIYDIVRGRISSTQLAKNLATTIGSVTEDTSCHSPVLTCGSRVSSAWIAGDSVLIRIKLETTGMTKGNECRWLCRLSLSADAVA